jgi:transposase
MLNAEEQMEIKILFRQGISIKGISRQLQVSRNTVRRYLKAIATTNSRPRARRAHKLEAYQSYIQQRVQAAHPAWLPATVLCREIKLLGYEGGLSRLRTYLRSLRTIAKPEPVIRFETLPGEQMQCDWIVFRRGQAPLSAFVATLGWSRASTVEFVSDEQLETLLRCHEQAFEFFGGVVKQALYDNMKTVVLARDAYGVGQHRFQPMFLDFARHYGFMPKLCRPYRAKTKGKVERFNGYLRRSFYNPLSSRLKQEGLQLDVETANTAVRIWLAEVANVRVHGTTQRIPQQQLHQEQMALQALPPPYSGQLLCAAQPKVERCYLEPFHCQPFQHDLATYEQLIQEPR